MPPLLDRLTPEGRDVLSRMDLDPETEANVAAWLLIDGHGESEPEENLVRGGCNVMVFTQSRRPTTTGRPEDGSDWLGGQLVPGHVLSGTVGRYRIKRLKKRTSLVKLRSDGAQLHRRICRGGERYVIVRLPRVDADMSDEGAAARLALLADLLEATVLTQRRLIGSEHVAELIHHGDRITG